MIALPRHMIALALGLASFGFTAHTAVAGDITITRLNSGSEITLAIEDASLDTAVAELGKAFGFSVQTPPAASDGITVSGSYTGPLDNVVQRLLRNTNHLIIRKPDGTHAISRIVIIGQESAARTARAGAGDAGINPAWRAAMAEHGERQRHQSTRQQILDGERDAWLRDD